MEQPGKGWFSRLYHRLLDEKKDREPSAKRHGRRTDRQGELTIPTDLPRRFTPTPEGGLTAQEADDEIKEILTALEGRLDATLR